MADTVIHTDRITNLGQLERFCEAVRDAIAAERVPGLLTSPAMGEDVMTAGAVRCSLVKRTLTDGSAVFDIVVAQ